MASVPFYILVDGKRFGTMFADHFTLDGVIPNGTTTPKPTTIFDKYYRDLNGGGIQNLFGSSDAVINQVAETAITPGSPDTATLITAMGAATNYTGPDDATHTAPRQLKYQESIYQFWGDAGGTVLVGIVPYADNIGVYNQLPNMPYTAPP